MPALCLEMMFIAVMNLVTSGVFERRTEIKGSLSSLDVVKSNR